MGGSTPAEQTARCRQAIRRADRAPTYDDRMALQGDLLAVRQALKALGAPLAETDPVVHFAPEEAVVRAVRLLYADATLLRVLPVVVARRSKAWDWNRFAALATDDSTLRRLGMVVELSGWLAGDSKLRAHARLWRDRLNPGGREYLLSGLADRMLADQRTPTVAREWGVLVNMSEETLRAFFGKHVA